MARFSIEIRFTGGLNAVQEAAFQDASNRWTEVIVGDFPRIQIGKEIIETLVIEASGAKIDQAGGAKGNILGQSSPTDFLPNGLPAKGFMEFDNFDLGQMETDGTLHSVILHEMGHVLGIGSIWKGMGLLAGPGTANPRFVGTKAGKEWRVLSQLPANQLPVENRGGPGTADSHWRESVFGNELMTGFISGMTQPISRMTIASLADLGYRVSFSTADPFTIPSHLVVRAMGVGADPERVRRCTFGNRPIRKFKPTHWPEAALV